MTRTPRAVAEAFARALDEDDYAGAARSLAADCVYETAQGRLQGPAAILRSYAEASAWGRRMFDEVVFTSEFAGENGTAITILFTDVIARGELRHTYRTGQVFTVGTEGTIEHIAGLDLPGEREGLDAFFRRAGVKRSDPGGAIPDPDDRTT